ATARCSLYSYCLHSPAPRRHLPSFPTRRSSDLDLFHGVGRFCVETGELVHPTAPNFSAVFGQALCELAEKDPKICAITAAMQGRSEEHTSELQSRFDLVCRLLLEKKKTNSTTPT